eukprot:SM000042S15345  [mRNA]  locus=s42:439990:449765:- [translate_table: standard]
MGRPLAPSAREQCYNVELAAPLEAAEAEKLRWLLRETFEPWALQDCSSLQADDAVVEVGPRLSFTTAWSANAVSICAACGLGDKVGRIERSRRYLLQVAPDVLPLDAAQVAQFSSLVHDRMTECVYLSRLESFKTDVVPQSVVQIPVMEEGRAALESVNRTMGLAFDDWDLDYYTTLFRDDIGRNPTNVELFDIAQSNSEHSRHWFFQGNLSVDGEAVPHTLMSLVKETLKANPNNSVIGFKDNSSAIRGGDVVAILPRAPGTPSPVDAVRRDFDILFTAETHNFPCAVAPYPGAETGAGGRIRDTHATGIGSLVVAATAGYCVGNLQVEGHTAPWEDTSFDYPPNLAPPLQILLDASDGASDYGNKFGEPLIQGYTRSFGMRMPSGERREWLKPIMFSGGIGQIDHNHLGKGEPEVGMLVVKIGGPAYRIGMGGGAASSMVSGTRDAALDFDAVQRGDPEMAQKLYRVVRTCVELGQHNPIVSIHDQGAAIDVRSIVVGDKTMSVLEIWGAEYQEQDALLARPESEALLRAICQRERLSLAVIGRISGDGKVVLMDSKAQEVAREQGLPPPLPAVDLDLEKVLGDMPKKNFHFTRRKVETEMLDLPLRLTVADALERVFRLPAVCSKRFLTTKFVLHPFDAWSSNLKQVDRCVGGLVAQQQTVGPLQLALADVAVIAQTHTGITGGACAIGEQPLKMSNLEDVKASGNWMYAAKMLGEGAAMYDAAIALRDTMVELGIAIDGGKDSLSMAAQAGGETVMAPGNLVISTYVTCPDITLTVTPDLKLGDCGVLLHVDLGGGARRLGGSAFAHAYDQLGAECPDVDIAVLKKAFNTVQSLISRRLISAGHDISDGGLITALAEMAFAGNCGLVADVALPPQSDAAPRHHDAFKALFAEEPGLLIEVSKTDAEQVKSEFAAAGVPCVEIGDVISAPVIRVTVGSKLHVERATAELRDLWEDTSFALERLQKVEHCVDTEQQGLRYRQTPSWNLSFTPTKTQEEVMLQRDKLKVAVVREEGSNGDREMAAMIHAAGMEPWDIAMSDLLSGKASLQPFSGVVFVGGFSYGDVLDSAKGWAGTIQFNENVWQEFQRFYDRPDTFSLGVCNGCQLMALLGWVPGPLVEGLSGEVGDVAQPRFVHNESGRFECRFASVTIKDSPSLMLKGMAGTTVGIWNAHGEGRAFFPSSQVHERILESGLAPVRYCDDGGEPTEQYPFCPNGSPGGIAALCSPDGRHLAMMPHPERCFLMWQFPWYPASWAHLDLAGPSPWLRMFQNAREWLEIQRM